MLNRSVFLTSTRGMSRLTVSTSALLAALGVALPAAAQDARQQDTAQQVASASDAPDAAPPANDIVVTGSRIRTPNATSVSPINTVSGAEISARGATRVEDLINTLPQAYADQGGGNRGGTVGASGTATINLRNLGNQRTLVLIDGRRLMQGDPARGAAQAADINNVPAALIQRVDIVTGGASAVYGSDALAGVVNFILKRDFDGLQLDATAGLFTHTNDNPISSVARAAGVAPYSGDNKDGGQQSVSLTFGKNFAGGRGNVTAFVGYRSIDGVGTAARDFSSCNLNATAAGYACSLSSATSPAQFQLTNPVTGAVRGSFTLDSATGNSLRAYRSSDGFNNGNTYDLQAPDKRINADLFANYKFSDAAEAYGEFMFMRDEADIRLSPTATFSVPFSVNCSNPFLSASERNQICTSVGLTNAQSATVIVSLRNAAGGSRHDYTNHESYRGVLGLRGDVSSNWHYDIYGQYGRTNYDSRLINDYSLARFRNALRAVTNGNGQIVCESAATNPSCVPINIFAIGGITPDALNYVQNTVTRTGYTEEAIASASLTGNLGVTSPFASHGVGVAIGAEYRREEIRFTPDQFYSSRDVAGNSGGEFPIAGSFDVKEVYGEVRVPLVEDKPFVRSLNVEGGVRYSSYSTAGNTWAYKAGADWSPVSDIRFRGSYQRAVRAPNLVELFGPQRQVTASISDPCEGTTPRATAAQCAQSGVTATQYGLIAPAAGQQSGALIGGNPRLEPETSNTTSFGVQLTPRWLRGITMTADYFDIDVKKLITTVPAGITLNQCITQGVFCDLIRRNPATGSLVTGGFVTTTSINSGYLKTSGIDLSVAADQNLADIFGGNPGRLTINAAGTSTRKYETQILPGSPPYRCDGYFGVTCGVPIPKWRHRVLVTYTLPDGVALSATWRHLSEVRNDRSSSAPYLSGTYYAYDKYLPTMDYLDLGVSIAVARRYTLRLGVNNVFDKDPPLTASTGTGQVSNGPFYAGIYDALGRYVFAGVSARF
ncbi:TonB-dependent receptor [uncultured Sphingomonas sp.]|uniref:TonB-dependent receptor domain-containing protein n=1 Tax=uncultured Sphingomonas sp. TaxID=158754 RepID=UPI0025F26F72|nr:TonB-dependent receptor [uncultured Sphingomonas sp.]